MAPVDAVQVTPALAESFVTVALKVWFAPPMRVAVAGLTETLMAGVDEVPPPPQPDSRANAIRGRRREEKKPSRNAKELGEAELRVIDISVPTTCSPGVIRPQAKSRFSPEFRLISSSV